MKGLIQLYCGDGKGKTTASVGLAVRAAGAGQKVLFVQFLKNGNSSEVGPLKTLGIATKVCRKPHGFLWTMSEEEKARAAADYTGLLAEAFDEAQDGVDLLILDEAIGAAGCGMIPEAELIQRLKTRPDGLEVVLTGRDPSEALMAEADYITEMKKIRHPFDKGIDARRGIEY